MRFSSKHMHTKSILVGALSLMILAKAEAQSLPTCATAPNQQVYDKDIDCLLSALTNYDNHLLSEEDVTEGSLLSKLGVLAGDKLNAVSFLRSESFQPVRSYKREIEVAVVRKGKIEKLRKDFVLAAEDPGFQKAVNARREEIRGNFLKAIKEAAERRAAEEQSKGADR